jgi:pimeloyl-ACP methyl ester carboxylesterase
MAKVHANDIDICFEDLGDPDGRPLLLVMGLGCQLITWPDEMCEMFVARGFRTVRYDNRDAGESTWFDERGLPDLFGIVAGDISTVAYSLADMTDDAIGLLDTLSIESAHVFGVSMGGMIAQDLAIRYPGRVRSLCSTMSTTGDRSVGQPTARAVEMLLRPAATNREEVIELEIEARRVIGSPGYPFDEEFERDRIARHYERAYHRDGTARQLAAILAAPDRTASLGSVRVPTLVIHGDGDPLIDVSGGRATAAAVPGSKLEIIEGMGHDLPLQLYEHIVATTSANAEEAERLVGGQL